MIKQINTDNSAAVCNVVDSDAPVTVGLNIMEGRRPGTSFSHRHSTYIIYWIHEGNGTHLIDFQEFPIHAGRVFFLRPEQVHLMRTEGSLHYSFIQFHEDLYLLFSDTTNTPPPAYVDLRTKAETMRFKRLFLQIEQENTDSLPYKRDMLQGLVRQLLIEIVRTATPDSNAELQLPEKLQQYRELIEQNFKIMHLVSDYAMFLGISTNYLNVLTQQYLGCSALSLINSRIVLEVKRKLMGSDMNISEIAYYVGFKELSYFSRFFKHHTGERPLEFRQRMNKMYQS